MSAITHILLVALKLDAQLAVRYVIARIAFAIVYFVSSKANPNSKVAAFAKSSLTQV